MAELISEPITPTAGTSDTAAMGRGEPGLPSGFTWKQQRREITEVISAWKHSSPEGARAGGDVYLRRHYYKLKMSDKTIWTVYFLRQSPRSGKAQKRWFLYTVE